MFKFGHAACKMCANPINCIVSGTGRYNGYLMLRFPGLKKA